ncbi:rhodanese-like domain-containing protein 4, chloroplastic [Canna indica]|uniref:Rhodanese-like domain-containing protein 4, chloroplastic n=1 Tax=Canna indica TaxID=4628 RepID=A0AAQ3K951_9LILI|nr:rhodanese-like domain-containing protein 4, chloroplastic [Canna indica]
MAPLQDHRFIPKPHVLLHFPASLHRNALPIRFLFQKSKSVSQIPLPPPRKPLSNQFSARKIPTLFRIHVSSRKISPLSRIPASFLRFGKKITSFAENRTNHHSPFDPFSSSIDLQLSTEKTASFAKILALFHNFALIFAISFPSPTNAAEGEQVSQKINIEQILISIDDFFNRNPFFVAGLTVIWLVVIPLTQGYLKKYKFISAIDAFRKLRDLPNAQLLDVRKRRSLKYMASPNLKILNKNVVQVEYSEADEEGFIKEVLQNFEDPQNTVICVLDNFDGDSLKLAELLYKNGFKEAYAIKGGLRGKNGWQEIQETYLPPSMHVYPRKQLREQAETKVNNEIRNELSDENDPILKNFNTANGSSKPTETLSATKINPQRPLSPYPNYPELKPPSSPSPSKPSS